MEKKNKIIIIVGPTASGKSEFAVLLAKKINAEIISADSRQVYRGLDIGSGKVHGHWRRHEYYYKDIRHHCIDIADPKKIFTAADFVKCGRRALTDIMSRGKTPIIVGGAGFYIDALLGRTRLAMVPPNKMLRKKLASYSTTQLFNYLTKLDPDRAKTVDFKNPRRLIRAIEISQSSNLVTKSPSTLGNLVTKFEVLWLGIQKSPDELKKRIHIRLLKRLPGIIREIKRLNKQGASWKRMNELGLEYRYASMFAQKKITKNEMIKKIEIESWHYAKRQMTWWRKNKEIRWISN